MNENMKIPAGTPDDDNRYYLPESIYGSDVTVNDNGNSSHPYPKKLLEFQDVEIAEGFPGTWYEYVPESYTGETAVPLVISCHGGLMTGWGQCIYSSWSFLSEREGFIVIYPNAYLNHFWQGEKAPGMKVRMNIKPLFGIPFPEPVEIEKNYDANFVLKLIDYTKEKYNIDMSRVYIQGMSNGAGFSQMFTKNYGYKLAAAAFSAGSGRLTSNMNTDGTIRNNGGPVNVWISHPELNWAIDRPLIVEELTVREDRYYWAHVNGISSDCVPTIRIEGEHNITYFKGEKADLVFDDIKNRDHGQALDEAFYYWDYMFSGMRRTEDGVERNEPNYGTKGDESAAAFELGSDKVWWKNQVKTMQGPAQKWEKIKYHGLNGKHQTRGSYYMVPISFLAEMAGGSYEESRDALTAMITLPDGRELQFARGCIGCVIDDKIRSMYCEAILRDGVIYASVEWFAKYILGWYVSECNDVLYVTDHFAELGHFTAEILKDLFKGSAFPQEIMDRAYADWKKTQEE